MTDEELAKFLNIPIEHIHKITPAKRQVYEAMRAVELWDAGFGPKPKGILVDYPRRKKQ